MNQGLGHGGYAPELRCLVHLTSKTCGFHSIGVATVITWAAADQPAREDVEVARQSLKNSFHEQNIVSLIDLGEFDFDHFAQAGLDGAADKAGMYGQFPMTAIDEHTQFDLAGTAMRKERV